MCFITETKENKKNRRVRVSDLIQLPKIDLSSSQKPKRRAPASAPSYHLTSRKSLKFIEEADIRQKENDKKEKELDKIKKRSSKTSKKSKSKGKQGKKETTKTQKKSNSFTSKTVKSSENFRSSQIFN